MYIKGSVKLQSYSVGSYCLRAKYIKQPLP